MPEQRLPVNHGKLKPVPYCPLSSLVPSLAESLNARPNR